MGQEIGGEHFRHQDFRAFDQQFRVESRYLADLFASSGFSRRRSIAGLELEAWLIDPQGDPIAINEELLDRVASPAVVPELSRFNVEFNVEPQGLSGSGLSLLGSELSATWRACQEAVTGLGAGIVAIGILPTIQDQHLSLANLSNLRRYRALNEQVLRLRRGRPLTLRIGGRSDILQSEHRDVMLEAAATSLQLHLQVGVDEAARYFNAALVAAAPTVAVACNAPFLFGKDLWEETRIPVFEQAVNVGEKLPRVTFGTHFAADTLESVFQENADQYEVLLPFHLGDDPASLAHVRLHNGTCWRWVRPLIGFDGDGTPHLRIEHRVMSAGPSLVDMMANAAFFYGLVEEWAQSGTPPEAGLPFESARRGFYEAARFGLHAEIPFRDGKIVPIRDLLLTRWIDQARAGLNRLKVTSAAADEWMTIIAERVASMRTGSHWQRATLASLDGNREALVGRYRDLQRGGEPVHRWPLPT